MRIKYRSAAIAIATACLATPAFSTSLVELDLKNMVAQSQSVVVGEATAQSVKMTEEGLYTITTFNVSDAVVGTAGASVSVAVPGGVYTLNGRRFAETWPGAPIFAVGQEAVLFLNDGVEDNAGVVGFSQGVLTVTETAAGKSVRLPGGSKSLSLQAAKDEIRAARNAGTKKLAD